MSVSAKFYTLLNSDHYTVVAINMSFTKHRVSQAYKAMCDFKKYCGIGFQKSSCQVTPLELLDLWVHGILSLACAGEWYN